MARRIRSLILLVACSVALHTLSRAQPSTGATPPRQVQVKFTVFALGGLDHAFYHPRPSRPLQPLRFYTAYRSPFYDYRGPQRIHFFGTPSPASDTPPLATYDVPEGARQLLLLFLPARTPSPLAPRYEVVGVDDSTDRVPAGSFTTLNLSGRDYLAQQGSQRLAIPQGLGSVYPGKGRVALLLATRHGDHWISAGRHEFTMGTRDRVTLIFYPPASPTSIYPLIRRLVDSPASAGTDLAQDSNEE